MSVTKKLVVAVLLTAGIGVAVATGAIAAATTTNTTNNNNTTAPLPTTVATTATTGVAGSTSPATSQGSTTATTASTRDNRGVAGLVLLFGAAGIAAVLGFVFYDRRQTLAQYAKLIAVGADVHASDVSPQAAGPPTAAEAARPTPLTITGPNTVVVGVAADFIAQAAGTQVVATWTAEPATMTGPLGSATSRLSLTAAEPGAFTLSATPISAGAGTRGTKKVTAVAADRARQVLPFIGAGWGSVVVAIVIAAVTGTLGLAGGLNGEAVATILGALAGYVVAKGQTETRPSQTTGSGGGAGSGTPPVHGA